MMIVDIASPQAAGEFPYASWLEASSSGQPSPVALSVSISSSTSARVRQLSGGRFLLLGVNTSNYPFAQIVDQTTPSAGAAVVIVSSAVTIDHVARCKANTDRFLALINNDVYLIDCGSSGTTVTVTPVSSTAGDATRGEAFTDRTRILIAEDDSHFVTCNDFDNAGTRSFVSALFTITYGGSPAATYVARDVDATGGSASLASGNTFGGDTSTAGTGFYCGLNASSETTSLRFNKITYTSSTVANSVSTLTLGTAATGVATLSVDSMNFASANRCALRYVTGSNQGTEVVVSYSGSPALDGELDGGGRGVSSAGIGASERLDAIGTRAFPRASSGGGTVGFEFVTPINNNIMLPRYGLITGLTTPAVYAIGISSDGNWACALGKTSTNTGQAFVMKNTDA